MSNIVELMSREMLYAWGIIEEHSLIAIDKDGYAYPVSIPQTQTDRLQNEPLDDQHWLS